MITLPDARAALPERPTPLQRITRMEHALGRPCLYVKRDDLMPVALGGNKLRSLEFWLGQALTEGADTVLVAGGPNSNMCILAAAATSILGLDCVVFHNASATPQSRDASFFNRLFGASVRYWATSMKPAGGLRWIAPLTSCAATGASPISSAIRSSARLAMSVPPLNCWRRSGLTI